MAEFSAADGCRIYYESTGSGDPVLLVSGLGGQAAFWNDVISQLRNRFTVISFDHRGTGRSDRPDGKYSARAIAGDAAALLGVLGYHKVSVVGHSTGGLIAQSIAIDTPQLVDKLVISGSWARRDAQFRAMFEARLAVLLEGGAKPYQMLTHALGFPADYLQRNESDLRLAVDRAEETLAPVAVTAARIQMLLDDDRARDLGRISCPTLIVGAGDDPLIPFHHARQLAQAIPHADLVQLDGSHFFPRVHPRQFARLVEHFVGGGHGP